MLTGSQQLNGAQQLHDRAQRCRELADTALTEEGRFILCEIARRYECEATVAEGASVRAPLETSAA
jgi:hypothetical protein